jgi:diguanylate cyclase (GGDEF)-like protein/putative nucleotidyltransferase with HDIG domain
VPPSPVRSPLEAVHRLSRAVLRAATPADVTDALVVGLRDGLGLGQVHLSEVSQGGEVGHATVAAGEGPGLTRYVQVLDERPSGVARVVATGEPLIVTDARDSGDVRQDLVERFDVASLAYVPLHWGGEVRYVAILISHERREFDAEAIAFAETLANQAASALALLESEQRRSARAERDAALSRAAIALGSSLELVEVLETFAREADLAMGGALAGVYLADGSGGGVATAGHNVDPSWTGIVLSRGEGVAGRVLTTGKPFVTNAYRTEIETAHESLGAIQTAAGVPMVWNGELKGALSVGFTEMRRVTEEDLRALEAIAALAVVACRNAEAYQRARVAAATDSLTGLMNHGALHLRAREEISRARRSGTPLSCLLLDLDDFKTVNDERGHQAGDEQLRAVAAALRSELRDHDVVARYGGDEFVVLLPDADPAGSRVVAERIAAAVPMRCSIGVAQWGEPLSADELLDRADRALLLAKRTGKERVAVAGADLEQELELLEARAGSTDATMREFWEIVAASESSRQTLLTLPAFVHRTIGAEEVALFELEDDSTLVRAGGAHAPDSEEPMAFEVERVPATTTLRERLALGAISRPTLAGILAAIGAEDLPDARGAPAGAYAVVPLLWAGRPHGLIALRTRRELSTERLRLLELLARQTMAVFTAQPASGSPAAVQALAAAIEARDNYTHEHSEQVVSLATDVAKLLGLPPAELDAVRHGALLHDVGKLAIPNEILHKPGPLTDAEWRVMAEHPVIGERILRRTPQLGHLAPIVRHEHERWDGRGYPDGLAGADIPIASRIILACDAYNAMITTRPYRDAMSPADAVAELRDKSGTQFDPQVVAALLTRLRVPALPTSSSVASAS